jgi:hypothetical protein
MKMLGGGFLTRPAMYSPEGNIIPSNAKYTHKNRNLRKLPLHYGFGSLE